MSYIDQISAGSSTLVGVGTTGAVTINVLAPGEWRATLHLAADDAPATTDGDVVRVVPLSTSCIAPGSTLIVPT
jgi:hypothetical protein